MFTDFNKLNTFLEVARAQSVSKAADYLSRTQSAITQQIQSLEEELELTLFDRKNARIYLTPEGERIYHHAKERFQEITDNLLSIRGDLRSLTGTIRIAVRPDFAHYIMPLIIANFKAKYPKVNFKISHANANETEQMLIDNKVEFGFLLFVRDKKIFDIFPLEKKDMILVATPQYLKSRKPIKKTSDLLEHDLVDYTEDNDALAYWMKKFDKKNVAAMKKKKPSVVCDDSALAKEMVLKHLGIGLMPKFMVEPEVHNHELVEILPRKKDSLWMSFDLILRKKRSHNLVQEEFLRFCLNEIGN